MSKLNRSVFGWQLCCAALLLSWLMPAQAIERLAFSVASIEGAGWQAADIKWSVPISGAGGQLHIASLQLPAPYGQISELKIHCPDMRVEAALVSCSAGSATASAEWLDTQAFAVSFSYQPGRQHLQFQVDGLPAFGGRLDLAARYTDRWRFNMQAAELSVARFQPLAATFAPVLQQWQLAGALSARAEGDLQQLKLSVETTGLSLSDDQGRYATEAVQLALEARLSSTAAAWQGSVSLQLPAGQVYVEPVFADFAEYPAQLKTELFWKPDVELRITNAVFSQSGVMRAHASAQWSAGQWQSITAEIRRAKLASGYALYAKPFLLGSGLEALQTAGELDLDVELTAARLQAVDAVLRDVVLEDNRGRFAWDAVNGELHWRAQGEAPPSRLHWAGGAAYKLLFGASELALQSSGRDVRLLKPLTLPLLDGALLVRQFAAQGLGADDMALQFDGELKQLNMEALTTALAWPRFGGQLAGRLPDLDYRSGVLTVGGTLQAQVFDGEVQVENLRVQDPFGRLPQLFADVRIRDLDLEAVTQAFSFGRIQGRLEGDVSELQMLNWKPVAFDARLGTPADDDSRHRISQRAIENISAIGGGGATAVLSRGFLRFFEDFAYDRIGLSCRLRGGVCLMGGVGPSKDGNGYVLVKGRMLPRIDVIGYAREVDWETLVEQLKSVTEGEGPVLR